MKKEKYFEEYPNILLAHGGGGRFMHQLIEKMFIPCWNNKYLSKRHDAAVIDIDGKRLAMTTDSYVVDPLFFPGGDIGKLAVYGTVNDISMAGAKPGWISAGMILEEGLPMETLWKIVCSMKEAADRCGIDIITGDTKVVDKGKCDGIFINTTGIGIINHSLNISPENIQTNDVIIINGDTGRHGMAIMAVREGLEFECEIESDTAPLSGLVEALIAEDIDIHCMRDLTRGGLGGALNELIGRSSHSIEIVEDNIPVREDVRGACEILGFDPLYVANEGRMVLFVPGEQGEAALSVLRSCSEGKQSSIIGRVTDTAPGTVILKTTIGSTRIVDMLSGEQLPRIC